MLLCDGAQESNGKLYILGGGWSQVLRPNEPVFMTLAVKMAVPWDRANLKLRLEARLVDADGDIVMSEAEEPIGAKGELEVGRPPGLKPGEALDAPFVLPFNGITLSPGGYVWELLVDDEIQARSAFRVRYPPGHPLG
jgi:hypothetical protein